MTDEQLMAQIQAGALHLLAVLYDRHKLKLFKVIITKTRNQPLSEDLVQETFLAILKGRKSYKLGLPFDSWMYGIAYNRVNAHLKGTHHPDFETSEMPQIPDSTPGPHEQYQKAEHLDRLARALKALTPEERELLKLSQELKYKDIAPIIGCDPGAVKHRVSRALQKLRDKYDLLLRRGA